MSLSGYLTSVLPHKRIPVPYRSVPDISLVVYLDTELGIAFNRREPEVVSYFRNLIESKDVDTVYDIGANIGAYTFIALSDPDITVHAFEPHPENVNQLVETATYNDLLERVQIVNKAVWKSTGSVNLVEGNNPQTHSVTHKDQHSSGEKSIEAVSLCDYVEETGVTPDLIKVDVEGVAGEIFEGAHQLLTKNDTDWIVEFHGTKEREAILQHIPERYSVSEVTEKHIHISP